MQQVTTGAVTQLWQSLIREAEQRQHTRLDESLESYLVFTLVRHSRDALLTSRTLALEFLDGLDQTGSLRDGRLRDVGDRCLLIAGLFAGQSRRRRVSERYFIDIGQSAYRELGDEDRGMLASLYRQLASAFDTLVGVLKHVRDPETAPEMAVPATTGSPVDAQPALPAETIALIDGRHRRLH